MQELARAREEAAKRNAQLAPTVAPQAAASSSRFVATRGDQDTVLAVANFMQQGDMARLSRSYDALLKGQWHFRELRSGAERGWTALRQADRAAAEAAFIEALSVNPKNADAWFGLGVAMLDPDRNTGALAMGLLLQPGVELARRDDLAAALAALQVDRTDFNARIAQANQYARKATSTLGTNAGGK
jgi:tetratricopeptide (TPR) repeat protein